MRIAICISGQPRSWEKCYKNWADHLLPNVEKDIFFHFWDYNTLPSIALQYGISRLENITISTDEKEAIISTYKPKKYKFDNRNLNPSYGDKDKSILTEYVSDPIGSWCRSQYYSLYFAANLKRQYEIENNFEYDIVCRMRSDLYFTDNLNIPDKILSNSVYSKSNGYMDNVETFMIADTFYLSDSYTYDQISEFVHSLYFIDRKHVVPPHIKCPPPETAFYPYLCASGITNISYPQNIKIARTQEYFDIKGELAQYEVI